MCQDWFSCWLYDLAIAQETSWLLYSFHKVCTKMFKSSDDHQIDVVLFRLGEIAVCLWYKIGNIKISVYGKSVLNVVSSYHCIIGLINFRGVSREEKSKSSQSLLFGFHMDYGLWSIYGLLLWFIRVKCCCFVITEKKIIIMYALHTRLDH